MRARDDAGRAEPSFDLVLVTADGVQPRVFVARPADEPASHPPLDSVRLLCSRMDGRTIDWTGLRSIDGRCGFGRPAVASCGSRALDGQLFLALTDGVEIERPQGRRTLGRGEGLFVPSVEPTAGLLQLRLPRSLVSPPPMRQDVSALHLSAHDEAMALLWAYLETLLRLSAAGAAPSDFALRQLGELVGAAIGSSAEHGVAGCGSARATMRLRLMLAAMADGHADPTLDMRRVATAAGVSARTGYQAFTAAGIDFSEHLFALRLDRAMERLRSGRQDAPRILELALSVGFSDLSHFNRRFRARFGIPPGEARAPTKSGLEANAMPA